MDHHCRGMEQGRGDSMLSVPDIFPKFISLQAPEISAGCGGFFSVEMGESKVCPTNAGNDGNPLGLGSTMEHLIF